MIIKFLFALVFVFQGFCYGQYDPSEYTTGTFEGCEPEGTGGCPFLNTCKNRDIPPDSYHTFTVDDVLNLPSNLPGKYRVNWPQDKIEIANQYESLGVKVEGYLIGVKEEDTEHCNCQLESQKDFHLWLAKDHADKKSKSVVVEISPRMLDDHAKWNKDSLNALKQKKTKVRISGWLFWETRHGSGNSRGTRWEIHPIHKIEVWRNNSWKKFK